MGSSFGQMGAIIAEMNACFRKMDACFCKMDRLYVACRLLGQFGSRQSQAAGHPSASLAGARLVVARVSVATRAAFGPRGRPKGRSVLRRPPCLRRHGRFCVGNPVSQPCLGRKTSPSCGVSWQGGRETRLGSSSMRIIRIRPSYFTRTSAFFACL